MTFQIPTVREGNAKLYDQFFTKEEHAIDCVKFFAGATTHDINKFDCVVEPSFGKVAFLKAMVSDANFDPSKLLFVDLDAKDERYRQDFLAFDHDRIAELKSKSCLTIGNPPFGKNASLAVAFFNKAAEYSSVIAFIVPRTFFKTSLINKLDKRFVLAAHVMLPEEVFMFEGKSYSVPCVFQVWTRGTREHIREAKETDDFKFVDKFHGDFGIRRCHRKRKKIRSRCCFCKTR